jgi:hypothetical protein
MGVQVMVAVGIVFDQIMWERGVEKAIDVEILGDQFVVSFIVLSAWGIF